ncbi:MAG: M3 family oligoendopeptidase [Bacteroidota bacterium]
MSTTALPRPKKRIFLPKEFKITVWSKLKPYYNDLLKRPIESIEQLEEWIAHRSELDSAVTESFSRRYISITVDSSNQKAIDLYEYTVQELLPKVAAFEYELNLKLTSNTFLSKLPKEKYEVYIRSVKNETKLFHKDNLPLTTEVRMKSKEYGKIFSEMTIGMNGKQMTLQKAGSILEETDRSLREQVYHKIKKRILQDTEQLDNLFDELLKKRHQIAVNAGFENFRDYKFKELGRFDYTEEDCNDFHESIRTEILPILDEINDIRRGKMELSKLRPWDLNVDARGKFPLKPFKNIKDFINKTVRCLDRLDPDFGEVITIMNQMKHLDLDSRKGKRPGGYNIQLTDTGVPFIFMNATQSLNDLRTLLHESGHAIHSYLTRDLELNALKKFPSEISELAAMSMELLSMDHWDIFFKTEEDLKRAKINQLENVLKVLPWIAAVDKFQHWIYSHPQHNRQDRQESWINIYKSFSSNLVDHSGLEGYYRSLWHKQLHIFEVPFYYIEYGMAQLGAIAIWSNYRKDPKLAIKNYKDALKMGYTRPIGEIYAEAGIEFNFSREYVAKLGAFVKRELDKLV